MKFASLKFRLIRPAVAVWIAGCLSGAVAAAGPAPANLRVEYLKDPLAVDVARPRLSWETPAAPGAPRGTMQSAVRVLVASDAAALAAGRGDLWDSGKIESYQSIHVSYGGATLASGQECHWKVQTWNERAEASDWSAPASWRMGLLEPSDWKGQWIGLDAERPDYTFSGADWIWTQEKPEPPGMRYFRRAFDVPADRDLTAARLTVAADNRADLYLNGHAIGRARHHRMTVIFDVRDALKPGRNVLAARVENISPGNSPAGLLARLDLDYASGDPGAVTTDAEWRTAREEAGGWIEADFNDTAWEAARVIGPAGIKPWGVVLWPEDYPLPARWLRKEFVADRPIRRAVAHVSGLGHSEFYVNGAKAGDDVLSPGLTHYSNRVFYVTHDITPLLRPGTNAVGAVLGNGRYWAPRRHIPMETYHYGSPKLLAQVEIEYADGTRAIVASDPTWSLTAGGPILKNNEYDGEVYDARRELGGWAAPGYDDRAWTNAQPVEAPGGVMSAQMTPPIRVTQTLRPIAVSSPAPGVHVFDMGQNMVGWCRIRVRGPAGTEVNLRHAETVHPDGALYMDNIRGAKVTDLYILRGGGEETWEPRFVFHGFRYVEVTGWPGEPTLDSIEGRVVHDDLESAGTWRCSTPLLNQIYTNVLWGARGNYRSIPTDCPQRDERQGWLGDRSIESHGETYMFRVGAFYTKWLQDIADAQRADGCVPDVAPPFWPLYTDNVTWPASLTVIPGHLLTQYADTAVVERVYPAIVKWIDHMSGYVTNGIMPRDRYGDWCVPPEDPKLIHSNDPARKTAPAVLGTAYFKHCADLAARYAAVLGREEDVRRFRTLSTDLAAAFNREFFREADGVYDNGSQTSCVLPLRFDIAPDEARPRVFGHLVDKIARESNNHVGTGLIGQQWLMRLLSDFGRADLAYTIASQTTYPSWGYMIENGATTIWELWNGNTADPAMNSHNHLMLVGDLIVWYYEYLAGIRPDPARPGFKRILMNPHPVDGLDFVEARHHSPYGPIVSEWRREGGVFRWRVEIPPNTTAQARIPADDPAAVTEGGRPLAQAGGITVRGTEPGAVVCEMGSGTYDFASPLGGK